MSDALIFLLQLVFLGAVVKMAIAGGPPGRVTRWSAFVLSAAIAGLVAGSGRWVACVIWSASAALWARAAIRFDEVRSRDEGE